MNNIPNGDDKIELVLPPDDRPPIDWIVHTHLREYPSGECRMVMRLVDASGVLDERMVADIAVTVSQTLPGGQLATMPPIRRQVVLAAKTLPAAFEEYKVHADKMVAELKAQALRAASAVDPTIVKAAAGSIPPPPPRNHRHRF